MRISRSERLSPEPSPVFMLATFAKQNLNEAVADIQETRFLSYSTFALLVYDHILTVPNEVRFMWLSQSRWTTVKWLFMLNRYISILVLTVDMVVLSGLTLGLSDSYCRIWMIVDCAFELLSLYTVTLIIAFRVHMIWGNQTRIFYLAFGAWSLHTLASLAIASWTAFHQNVVTYRHDPYFNICLGDALSLWLIWVPSIAFHTFIFILLVIKGLVTPRKSQTAFLKILLRDGMLFFAVVFVAFLFNLLIWAIGRPTLVGLPKFSVWAVSTLAIARMIFSIPPFDWSKQPTASVMQVLQSVDMQYFEDHELEYHSPGISATRAGHLVIRNTNAL